MSQYKSYRANAFFKIVERQVMRRAASKLFPDLWCTRHGSISSYKQDNSNRNATSIQEGRYWERLKMGSLEPKSWKSVNRNLRFLRENRWER